jgi:hypothetical protein
MNLEDKVDRRPNGCWIYKGRVDPVWGYAVSNGKAFHRVVYEELVGPIPEGMDLDHKCLNPACCNPEHLTPLTKTQHRWLTHRRQFGQMPRSSLRVARRLHDRVAKTTYPDMRNERQVRKRKPN